MQTITDEYRKLNKELHKTNDEYGTSGLRWVKEIFDLSERLKTKDILDYGCGKSTFAHNFPFKIKQYDPAVERYSATPEPADIVVCTDVLEHIEPELLDNVLGDLARVTKIAGFFSIAHRPAVKFLSDGRNAHLIIESPEWWMEKLKEHFTIADAAVMGEQGKNEPAESLVVVIPKGQEVQQYA